MIYRATVRAIHGALTADATLLALLSDAYDVDPIFTGVPATASGSSTLFPYISFDGVRGLDEQSKSLTIRRVEIDISIWSRYDGLDEILAIADRADTVLHEASISASGARIIEATIARVDVGLEQDGETRRATLTLEALSEKTGA